MDNLRAAIKEGAMQTLRAEQEGDNGRKEKEKSGGRTSLHPLPPLASLPKMSKSLQNKGWTSEPFEEKTELQ